MTTTDTATKYRYQGNGSTDTFAFSGRVFATTDLVVEIITRATDALVETLTINTDYSVTIAANGTASVVVTNALKIPSSLQDIQLRRVLPQSQSVSLPTGTVFPAKVVETGLDRVTALVQDLDEAINRSIKLPAQTSATTAATVEPEDDKILAWDGTTGQLKNGPTTASFTDATNTAVAAAATATTQAGIATTAANNASAAETAAEAAADLAVAAAAGVDLPVIGAAHTVLQVNTAGTELEYALLGTENLGGTITTAGKNLLDDVDAAAQRTTLGLGTAATEDIGDFATAAQGLLADSALQPGDLTALGFTRAVKTDTESLSVTAGSWTNSTFTASITPKSASSKILVIMNIKRGTSDVTNAFRYIKARRDSTDVYIGDAASNRLRASGSGYFNSAGQILEHTLIFIDEPATTSAITYGFALSGNQTETAYINRSGTDTDTTNFARAASSITLIDLNILGL
jgi:hypothetical protein